jgi:hypothetical protein
MELANKEGKVHSTHDMEEKLETLLLFEKEKEKKKKAYLITLLFFPHNIIKMMYSNQNCNNLKI